MGFWLDLSRQGTPGSLFFVKPAVNLMVTYGGSRKGLRVMLPFFRGFSGVDESEATERAVIALAFDEKRGEQWSSARKM